MNHVPGAASGDRVAVLGRTLPVEGPRREGAVEVLVRPEAMIVTPDPDGTATVVASSFRGSTARPRVRLADGTELLADVPGHESVRLAFGVTVTVTLVDRPVLVSAAGHG
ncbi:TOBE domain-containing protein [Microtetraspora niveoalba]|uniref:TOBE domain-containing protein n=1 Tax=Microtetraspora niveoalba TaxID=46175 RepID=UPI000A587118|nr:TOBE domain-containing protein [Microtetraspora niveoalba]